MSNIKHNQQNDLGINFEICYVPLPPERWADWRQAIHIIANMLKSAALEELGMKAESALPRFSPVTLSQRFYRKRKEQHDHTAK